MDVDVDVEVGREGVDVLDEVGSGTRVGAAVDDAPCLARRACTRARGTG